MISGDNGGEPVTGLRILVVEDNPINQKVAVGLISRLGHTVDVAANGQIAVDRVRDTVFDLIFMDIHMPVMDGLEATKAIRQLEDGKGNVPIVAMTAKALSGDREACLKSGLDDYLAKPVDRTALAACITKFSHGREAAQQPAATTPPAMADLFDPTIASELRSVAGDDGYQELSTALLQTLEEQVEDLRRATQTNDMEAVAFTARSMSGAAANIGFPALSLQSATIATTSAEQGNSPHLETTITDLTALIRQYRNKFPLN